MNIPKGPGPFPVIVSVHGYAPEGQYDVFYPQADFADILADNQFVVVHPGLRNYAPSDHGDNLLRVGMTVDVMNLIALLKDKASLPAELAVANPDVMGLWGYSMGGEIALRVLTLDPVIRATILYSSMSDTLPDYLRSFKNIRFPPVGIIRLTVQPTAAMISKSILFCG